MGKNIDITGKRFGKLTAIEISGKSKNGAILWLCKCDCGNIRNVISTNLRSGSTVSCGCLGKENARKASTKHGLSNTKIYSKHRSMNARCYNEKTRQYKWYGGRSIQVCDEWRGKEGFINFVNWSMENGYSDELQIDRIDVNGNYEPSNCRWVDKKIQANNTTANLNITIDGETKTMKQWSEEKGVNYGTLQSRVKSGWKIEDLFLPPEKTTKVKLKIKNKIAICSNIAGAGKDIMANYLKEKHGFTSLSFAKPIYEIAEKYFNIKIKDRMVLQGIGESLRQVDSNVWINYLFSKINKNKTKVVISDLRRLDEYERIINEGFTPVRIVVDRNKAIDRLKERDGNCDIALLDNYVESETRNIPMHEIHNDGSIEDFYRKIDEFVYERDQ